MEIKTIKETDNMLRIIPTSYPNRQEIRNMLLKDNIPHYILQNGDILLNGKYNALLRLQNT